RQDGIHKNENASTIVISKGRQTSQTCVALVTVLVRTGKSDTPSATLDTKAHLRHLSCRATSRPILCALSAFGLIFASLSRRVAVTSGWSRIPRYVHPFCKREVI